MRVYNEPTREQQAKLLLQVIPMQVIPMLNPPLPVGVARWFAEHDWTVVDAQRIAGGYAAFAVYRITALSPRAVRTRLVYKLFDPARSAERTVYERFAVDLADYMPRVFAGIEEEGASGLLLADAGVTLKSVLQRSSQAQQRSLVARAVTWLGRMHLRFAPQARSWLQTGTLAPYPVSSSVSWAEDALAQLAWAAEAGVEAVTAQDVRDVAQWAAWFYPRFDKWMQGPITLTHGDPHLENVLVQGDTWKLVDWEFTCAAMAQRDLAVFVQDLLGDDLREAAYQTYCALLHNAGWPVADAAFETGWLACFFDNTLMMLGWEVDKFRAGQLTAGEMNRIATAKLRWLRETHERLNGWND